MMKLGAMATINQVIDQETAQLVAEEMGHKVILRRENELEEAVMSDRDTGAAAEPRATVKPLCWTTFVPRKWPLAKRAALPSTSVLTTLKLTTG